MHLALHRTLVVLAVAAGVGSACGPGGDSQTTAPSILRLEPSTGPAGVAYPIQITIYGSGFAPRANTVRFGPISIKGLASVQDGTAIVFFVPKVLEGGGEVPPAVLQPGEYEVRVVTDGGTSNALVFVLTAGP